MTTNSYVRSILTYIARVLPLDLGVLLVLLFLTYAVIFMPVIHESVLRTVVGLVFLLFVPGYALVSALFPEAHTSASRLTVIDNASNIIAKNRSIDGIERIALSFGLSIALIPLFALLLTITGLGIGLVPVLLTSSIFIVMMIAVASFRRLQLPEQDRFRVPLRSWYESTRLAIESNRSRRTALNLVLALVILLSVSTLALAVVVPPDDERYTEFYILSENEDGDHVAANYSTGYQVGEPEILTFGFENYEGETVDYTVVIQLQEVASEGNDTTITNRSEIKQFSETVANNERQIIERNLTFSDELTGSDLRLVFLLYDSPPPENPDRENAKQSLHLWVDVEQSDAAE